MSMFKTILVSSLLLTCHMTYAATLPLEKCSQLKEPKTVLLIYAEWCPHCRHFMPEYKAVSNESNYSDWKFYTEADNDFHSVCGTEVKGVPTLLKGSNGVLSGEISENELRTFLNND